jgi:hypothetical protein
MTIQTLVYIICLLEQGESSDRSTQILAGHDSRPFSPLRSTPELQRKRLYCSCQQTPRGHVYSKPVPLFYTSSSDNLEPLLQDRPGPSRHVTLLAESFGTCLALRVAARAPQLISRLVLLNPATNFDSNNRLVSLAAATGLLAAFPGPLYSFAQVDSQSNHFTFLKLENDRDRVWRSAKGSGSCIWQLLRRCWTPAGSFTSKKRASV